MLDPAVHEKVPDPGFEAFWSEARRRQLESWMIPRHLVVDRFSFDPDEIGTTTDSDNGVW